MERPIDAMMISVEHVHAAAQRHRLRPCHSAQPTAQEGATELAEAGNRDQSNGEEEQTRVGENGKIGRQSGQAEEDRHEQRNDKASELLVDVPRQNR